MLVPNCIFRANGAAMLLTNRRAEARRAKYRLEHVVRVNMAGTGDEGYNCVYQTEDDAGDVGVRLSKDLTAVAAKAVMRNLARLGPLILPPSEKLAFAANLLAERALGRRRDPKRPYVPNFARGARHICIHAGGRAVVDGMQRVLRLSDAAAEPSRATLYRWGNVSSASVWYVLAFIETFRGVDKGDALWQLSFGSGFKCNSAVWRANRRVREEHGCWRGFDVAKMRTELAALDELLARERAERKAAQAAAEGDAAAAPAAAPAGAAAAGGERKGRGDATAF